MGTEIAKTERENDLGIGVDSSMKASAQYAVVVKKTNYVGDYQERE